MVGLGLALGGMFVPIVAWSIESIGWRETAFGCGVVAIVIGYPLACVFRRRPEDFGETVDGAGAQRGTVDITGTQASTKPEPEFTAKQALRTQAFWLLSAGHGVALIIVTAVNTHAINHMRISLGYTIAQASFYITLMTGFQVIGVLLGGVLGDKLQKNRVAAVCMTMHMVGMLMLTYALGPVMLVLFRGVSRFGLGHSRSLYAGDPGRLLRSKVHRHDSRSLRHVDSRGADLRTFARRDYGGCDG